MHTFQSKLNNLRYSNNTPTFSLNVAKMLPLLPLEENVATVSGVF